MSTQIHNALWAGRLWATRPLGFLLIWITMTVAAAICAAWAVGPASTPKIERATEGSIKLTLARQVGTPKAVAAVTLVAILLMFYIAMTLLWEDFTFDTDFTLTTLMGHNYRPPIWPELGRFFPLLCQEFNLIRHFTDTITGYYLIPIAQLLIFSGILFVVDDELSVAARAALVILVLLTPSVWISFNALTYSERNVLFFLTCLLLSVKRFEQTQSIAWAMAATICAQVMIYYKETAFLLLLGFAAGRLILRCRNAHRAGWDYDRLWDKESRLDLCLASLAILFLLYYLAVMGFQNTRYVDTRRHPLAEIVLAYLRVDLLAWLFVAVVLGRIYMILRRRVAPAPLWDGLALGGVGCFLAYLYLGIFEYYYLAPVDFIAVLYVGRLVILSWEKMRSWGKAPALVLTLAILLQDVSLLAVAIFERKNWIHGRSEIARVIEAQYRSRTGSALRLFFPFTDPGVIMEFAGYLNYLGVPVEGAADKAAGLNSVVLATRAIAKDGPCAGWNSIRCHAVSGPDPGDLVIVLPDDDEGSFAETSVYRARGELLLSYEPRPPIPQWLYSLTLPMASSAAPFKGTLPDRWLYGSVTIWK
jgi:hypothetical protein